MEIPVISQAVMVLIGAIVFGAATVKGVAGLGFPLITVRWWPTLSARMPRW